MWIIHWLKGLFNTVKEENFMPAINAGSIQKKSIATLRSAAVVDAIVSKTYVAPSADDISAAVTEFVDHLTLSDEATVRQSLGENFDAVAAAFADKSGVVAEALAQQVANDDKETYRANVQAYADRLQYKHSEDNGQDAGALTEQ
ncbi:hypothetical protein [Enterobacter cancerogenus]|uniref:hypothetical protein n=1 Tax=Enterobacter cancerogenus TaxID=69218 RepID=UPI001FCBA4BD|nr:hypothetical protein [Enterobacter cancerogenus]